MVIFVYWGGGGGGGGIVSLFINYGVLNFVTYKAAGLFKTTVLRVCLLHCGDDQ